MKRFGQFIKEAADLQQECALASVLVATFSEVDMVHTRGDLESAVTHLKK